MAALVLQALSMENPRCEQKGLELLVEIDTTLPRFLVGDLVRIRQVLVNLLANALKFTQRGSITLTVKRETPENPGHILFQVSDTGSGIEEEDMAHLFESFFRSSSSSIPSTSGTGLGLPISREIIQRMSGEIHVESTPGSGSIFWFVLPLAADRHNPREFHEEPHFEEAFETGPCTFHAFQAACEAVLPEKETQPFSPVHFPVGDHKVLIVEDNPVNQLVLERMIHTMGIPTLCVTDGEQALEAWKTRDISMVFMDIHMPHMDGFEATRAIRELESPGQHVPIIALTAGAFQKDKEKCLQSGMDEFVTKPFSFRQVVQLVTRFFPGVSSYDAPVQPDALAEKHDP
ncbi:MAG TPA: ATP-binding protein, partial [Thermotogota bacterium]|nr:ATP-binding protein [Thermotogota bacterium]